MDAVTPGRALIAGGDQHMTVAPLNGQLTVLMLDAPPVAGYRPSVNALFESVARVVGSRAIGVVLTGMGADGAEGVRAMRAAGAFTIAQDRHSSAVFGMPRAAHATGCIDKVLPLAGIAAAVARRTRRVLTPSASPGLADDSR